MNFPATGEILAPLAVGHFVAGCMRGSHQMPLMPVRLGSGISYFDGPPVIFCATFAQRDGRLTEPLDAFTHPFWDEVRARVAAKAADMRRQGLFGAAMLPMSKREYTGVVEKLATLDGRFTVRAQPADPAPPQQARLWGGPAGAAPSAQPSRLIHLHRNALRLGHGGQRHLEDSILESRFRLAPIHVPRQGDGRIEGTVPDLAAVVVALLFLFLVASLALDGDGALVDGNLQRRQLPRAGERWRW